VLKKDENVLPVHSLIQSRTHTHTQQSIMNIASENKNLE